MSDKIAAPRREPRKTSVYCTECGTGNSSDSKYCKECGHKVNDGYRTMMLSLQDLKAIEDEAQQDRLKKLLDMAFWHNESGNLDAAVLACEAALAIHPNCTTAHSLLGTLFEKKGEDARAIQHFEAVLALNPDSVADAVKLDQLRRGVHVKAVAPPVHYKWLPPALTGLSAARVQEKWQAWRADRPAFDRPGLVPALGAGAATVIVLVGGLALLRPHGAAPPAVRPVPTATRSAAPPTATLGSGYGGAQPSSVASLPPPVVLPSGPAATRPLTLGSVDPFSETLKPGTPTEPVVVASPPVARKTGTRTVRSGGGAFALPPLAVTAVAPVPSGGVAPAPVRVPAGALASLPQHTVVIRQLGSGTPEPSQTVASAPTPADPDNGVTPQIRITLGPSRSSASPPSASLSSPPTPTRNTAGGQDGSAEGYQQAALGLQQQGDYRRARAAYQKAIQAYQSQIAAGHDAETAQRGLQACQTGLQICQQSQL